MLGWMAMAVPTDSTVSGNLLFPLIMIALTLGAVVVTVYHPIAWSDDEVRLAVGGPAALGILVVLAAIAAGQAQAEVAVGPLLLNPLTLGFALVVTGGLAYLPSRSAAATGSGRWPRPPRRGPPRPCVEPSSPAAEGWLRLGSGLGLPILWLVVCLIGIPLAVYVALYLPWAFIDNHQLVPGFPAGNTGQTLVDLTGAMYRYHNDLTAAHAASSPGGPGRSTSSPSGSTRARTPTRPPRRSTTPGTWSCGGWGSPRWASSPTRRSGAGASRWRSS